MGDMSPSLPLPADYTEKWCIYKELCSSTQIAELPWPGHESWPLTCGVAELHCTPIKAPATLINGANFDVIRV